jgi:hypothetical protein
MFSSKLQFISQGVIQIFVSIGALPVGVLMILFPSGKQLQIPLEILDGSPFNNFLVPGIILFLINGVGQLTAGLMSFRRHPLAGYTGAVFGIGLMIWIFVQVSMIGGGHILQYSYFFLGTIETVLAFLIQRHMQK